MKRKSTLSILAAVTLGAAVCLAGCGDAASTVEPQQAEEVVEDAQPEEVTEEVTEETSESEEAEVAEYANEYDELEELLPNYTFFEGQLVYDAAAEANEEGSTVAYDSAMTIIVNGDVHQVVGDVENPTAVVMKDGVIEFVGSDEEALAYDDGTAVVIDADGKTVMPGMTEGHMHLNSMGISSLYEIVLNDVLDQDKLLQIVADFVEANPGLNVYSGRGWDVSIFGAEGPKKELLDEICSDTAIILKSADGHSTWTNSKALEIAGITKDTVVDGGSVVLGEDGEPQGYLKESAANLVADQKPVYTVEQCKAAFEWSQRFMASQGYTSVFVAGFSPDSDANNLTALEELAEEGKLKLHIRGSWWVQPYNFENWEVLNEYLDRCNEMAKGFKTEYFQINTIKLMADQVLEEATAYMPYYEDIEDHTSEKVLDESLKLWGGKEDMMKNMFIYATEHGMQIHIHQIADEAAMYVLDILEEIQKDYPNIATDRVAFAHCQFFSEETQNRMAALDVSAIVAPYWAVIDDYYWDVYEPLVGLETLQEQYPMESLVKKGINVAFHSDCPVTTPDMGWLYYSAVTRTLPQKIYDIWYEDSEDYVRVTDPDAPQTLESIDEVYGGAQPIAPAYPQAECLTMDDTIKASTYGGAYTIRMEDTTGSLEVGKKADVIILNQTLSDWVRK